MHACMQARMEAYGIRASFRVTPFSQVTGAVAVRSGTCVRMFVRMCVRVCVCVCGAGRMLCESSRNPKPGTNALDA